MKKIWSLIKACMTNDMSIFKIKTTGKSKKEKFFIIGIVSLIFMLSTYSYADTLIEELTPNHLEYIALSVFTIFIAIFTLIEGVYKSGSMLFNSKDDDLLLSLPIKKSTILFVRIFKFYVFELLFSMLFTISLVICYALHVKVGFSFYVTSLIVCLLLPIIPIVISSIVGALITWISSKFRLKNIVQTVFTMILFLGLFYLSFNLNIFMERIVQNSSSIFEVISKVYYPAGAYASLAINFSFLALLKFIIFHLLLIFFFIFGLSKIYFNINSDVKKVKIGKKHNKRLVIKSSSQTKSLIKKELNTFFQTPVFIVNAGFGTLIFLIVIVAIIVKFDSVSSTFIDLNIMTRLPLYAVIILAMGSFTTSITSSMVSLEGRNYYLLKSLPVSARKVLMAKVFASMLLTVPFFTLGDILLFVRFKIQLISIILILLLTISMPLISHFIGLIMNLKFPKLEFENAAEVVKQSISSLVSVMIGFVLFTLTALLLYKLSKTSMSNEMALLILNVICLLIDASLYYYLIKRGTYLFNHLESKL